MSKTYFIADLHFGHKNCLSYDDRPFTTIEEHDQALINNWNSVVGIDDDVWILGDISWHGAMKTIEIFNQLNGTKHLCVGNHDKKLLKNRDVQALFCEIVDYKEIEIASNCGIVLSHYPIPCFNNHYYGWYHFYGHTHDSFEEKMICNIAYLMECLYDKKCNMLNVGIMHKYMNFAPITFEQAQAVIEERSKEYVSAK